jgi:hypothetical protein
MRQLLRLLAGALLTVAACVPAKLGLNLFLRGIWPSFNAPQGAYVHTTVIIAGFAVTGWKTYALVGILDALAVLLFFGGLALISKELKK